jgi:hypothetical protein
MIPPNSIDVPSSAETIFNAPLAPAPSTPKQGPLAGRQINHLPPINLPSSLPFPKVSATAPAIGSKKKLPKIVSKTVSKPTTVLEYDKKAAHESRLFETFYDFEKRLNVIEKVLASFPPNADSTCKVDSEYKTGLESRLKINEGQKKDRKDKLNETRRLFKAIVDFLSADSKKEAHLLPLNAQKHSLEAFNRQVFLLITLFEYERSKLSEGQERLIRLIEISKELLQKRVSEFSKPNGALDSQGKDVEILILARMLKFEELETETELSKIKSNMLLIQYEKEIIGLSLGDIEKRKSQLIEQLQSINDIVEQIVSETGNLSLKIKPKLIEDTVLQQSAAKIITVQAPERITEGSGEIFKIGNRFIFKPIRGAPGMSGNDKNQAHNSDRADHNRLGFPNGSGAMRDYATALILGYGPPRCLASLPLFPNCPKERGLLVQYIPNIMDLQALFDGVIRHYEYRKLQAEIKNTQSATLSSSTDLATTVEEIRALANTALAKGIDDSSTEMRQIVVAASHVEKSITIKEELKVKTRKQYEELTRIQSKENELDSYQRALIHASVEWIGTTQTTIRLQDLAIWSQFSKTSIRKILVESFRIPNFDMNATNLLICSTKKDNQYHAVLIDREQSYPDTWQNIQPFFWLNTSMGSLRMSELVLPILKMDPEADIKTLTQNGLNFDSESWINNPDDPTSGKIPVGKDLLNIVTAFQLVAKVGLELDRKVDLKEHEQITANDVGQILCCTAIKKGFGRSLLHQLFLQATSEVESLNDAQQTKNLWDKFKELVEVEFKALIEKRTPKAAESSGTASD